MSAHIPDKSATIVPLAPIAKGQSDANIVADDSGRAIVALLRKATAMAKEDCAGAMDLAHKLSSQLRAAEERAREPEVEATHFRDRPRARKNGCCASMMKLRTRFFRRTIPPPPRAAAVKC
jgi:hypothetical protein